MLKRIDVKNKSDNLLLSLSMVYDLNFKASFEYLDKKKYIWKMYNKLNDKEKYLEYFKYIDAYIKERLM